MKNGTAKALLCAALGNVFWGLSFLFIKVALARVPDPNVMLAHRFTISALLMLLPVLAGRVKVSGFLEPLTDLKYVLAVLSLCLLCSIGSNMLVNYAAGRM